MSASEQLQRLQMGWFGADVRDHTLAADHLEAMAETESNPAVTGNLNTKHADPTAIYNEKFKLADRDQKLGDLDSEEARLKLLNKFTQNDSKVGDAVGDSSERCGSTVLIAAAIQGGGQDGIKTVLDQATKDLDPNSPYYDDQVKRLAAVQKSMKTGGLAMSDLHSLNQVLDHQLEQTQLKKYQNPDGTPKQDDKGNDIVPLTGVEPDVLEDYIAKNQTMKGYFADGRMSIDSVDIDGKKEKGADSGADHYVLHLAGQAGGSAIYDPFARKDRDQLVFDPEEQKNYQKHEYKPDQIDGADFGAKPFMGMFD